MGWPHGRAYANPRNPQTWGCCDRCAFVYNLNKLVWQYEWYGTELRRTGFRVCPTCLLDPNPQRRTLHLPPDPMPVKDPRPLGPINQLDLEAVQDEWGAPLLDEDGNQIFQN